MSDPLLGVSTKKSGSFLKNTKRITQKRIQYKKEGKELESLAIKTIINSGYGVFGDPKVQIL